MTDPADLIDVKAWEAAAYAWLYDAKGQGGRAAAWPRVMAAYPGVTTESAAKFWKRIKKTQWYKLNSQHFRKHQHGYADSWSDAYTDTEGDAVEEYGSEVFEEYDNEIDGTYSTGESDTVTGSDTEVTSSGDKFQHDHMTEDESDTEDSGGHHYEHHHRDTDSTDKENE
jgi:hypothetical protein